MIRKILVTAGTGKTGAHVVRRLLELGCHVRVASRSGEARSAGASVVRFDWTDKGSYGRAIEGMEAAYLVAPEASADPAPIMARFIDEARARGVRRFVLLSASSIPAGGPAMGAVHAKLAAEGGEWAVLRPSWFMQNFSRGQHLPTIRDEGVIYTAAADGRVPFVDAEDIAEVGVRALSDPAALNRDVLITGPEAIGYDRAAEIIGAACGRLVRHVCLSAEQLAARWQSLGLAPDYAQMLASMDVAIGRGAEDRTTDTVEMITGRPPRRFEDFARASADVWRR